MCIIKKTIHFFIIILFFGSIIACEPKPEEKNIEKIVEKYIQFQQAMGKTSGEDCLKMIPDIFSQDVIKNTDGHVRVKGIQELEKHCAELRNTYNNWHLSMKSQKVSDDKKTATVTYEIISDKAGVFEVVSHLKFGENQKIIEIDESYYQMEVNQQD